MHLFYFLIHLCDSETPNLWIQSLPLVCFWAIKIYFLQTSITSIFFEFLNHSKSYQYFLRKGQTFTMIVYFIIAFSSWEILQRMVQYLIQIRVFIYWPSLFCPKHDKNIFIIRNIFVVECHSICKTCFIFMWLCTVYRIFNIIHLPLKLYMTVV